MKNHSLLIMRGMEIKNPSKVFDMIDQQDKGFIYFHELYDYAVQKHGVDFSEV